jgi:endo-1,3(4)-beta-glucanase
MNDTKTAGRRLRTIAAAAGLALMTASCVQGPQTPAPGTEAPSTWAGTAAAAADALPRTTGPYNKPVRTASGILPPTNSWVSGAVFNDTPQPVFPGVLALQTANDGFGLGLPVPHATPGTVFGSYVADLRFTVQSDRFELSRLDSLSATFSYFRDNREIGRLTAAEGWPYLSYQALERQSMGVPVRFDGAGTDHQATVAAKTYHLIGDGVTSAGPGTRVDLVPGSSVTVYAEPDGADAATLDALRTGAVPLRGTTTGYGASGGKSSTTYSLDTGGKPTVFTSMPHQSFEGTTPLKSSYASIYGPLLLHQGMSFTYSVDERKAATDLDLSGLTVEERGELSAAVIKDASTVQFAATDSYYGGKALYRAVNLYKLARQLLLDRQAQDLKALILAEFDRWFRPTGCTGATNKCFTYDTTLAGIVGQAPAYGSDEFNDHHFHYGYFLYAVGAMALDDRTLVSRYRTVTDLLALDIASPDATEKFPQRRAFDDYAGHSWASGTSPFADGNNQESSSEAVNAWAGLSLWAQASDNQALASEATWMLSLEARTALDYWVYPAPIPGFTSPVVGLIWGGKRDYATFFDPSPAAILGIQLLPFGPTMDYLQTDPARITALVNQTAPRGATDLPLIDYNLMLLGMADKDNALARARSLPDKNIDNGNSRSYLLASIMART